MNSQRKTIKHYEIEGHAHYLTFSCYRQLPLFSKDRTYNWFVESLEAARQKHGFDLWAWVIMPNHAHLLIWPRQPQYNMGSLLRSIKQPVGTRAINYLKQNAPSFLNKLRVINKNRTYYRFWQPGPGYDANQVDPSAIHETIEYIHLNPVRAALVQQAIDWKYSSARDWAGLMDIVLKVNRTVPLWLPNEPESK